MNLMKFARRLIPHSLKRLKQRRQLPWRVANLIGPALPETICVDVGASYYPHVKWLVFLNAPNTRWVAVEPNVKNLGYLQDWEWPCQISSCAVGLSREGGEQTLYVTNVDSGSSLLPPEIPMSMKHRVTNLDYFFPVVKRQIETITLPQAIAELPQTSPIFIKLDTQGTELSILQGAKSLFNANRIVGIEMESTLLAEPFMKGAGKFWQACEYLEGMGFELLHVTPIAAAGKTGKIEQNRKTYLNECDAVFALRRDVIKTMTVEHRIGLLAFYLTYFFYEEALALIDEESDVPEFLRYRGCDVDALRSLIETKK
jgi:FkbM family methyltransferase